MRYPGKLQLHASFTWRASQAYAPTSWGTKQEFVRSFAESGGRSFAEGGGLSELSRFGSLRVPYLV